jgi:hypothetical protein
MLAFAVEVEKVGALVIERLLPIHNAEVTKAGKPELVIDPAEVAKLSPGLTYLLQTVAVVPIPREAILVAALAVQAKDAAAQEEKKAEGAAHV